MSSRIGQVDRPRPGPAVQNHTPVVLHSSFPTRGKTDKSGDEGGTVDAKQAIEPLLDVAQVAEIFGCSTAQVYAGVKKGWLKPVPLPYRTTRFTREEIERLLRGGSQP